MSSKHRNCVVVTGASSGIGRACALELDKAGYEVFATVRKAQDAESLRQAASEYLTPIFMDVTDETSLAAAVETVTQAVGEAGLVGLVNNAGVGVPGPIEYIGADDLRRQFEINVFGQVRVTQAFLPLIRQAQGRIINIGSVGGKITMPFGGALCASKHAMEAITDALRLELYPWGIHVILVAPASIKTSAVDRLVDDSEAAIRQLPPTGRQRYELSFRHFVETAAARENNGSPPSVVAQTVLKALTATTPQTRYPVGADARLLTVMPQLLPTRWLDKVRFKLFGLPQQFGLWANSQPSHTAQAAPLPPGLSS
ncbi:MAG: SDR family oxidoreductase [Anaerolineaceae bacterium]|nr:SDR family oxidoreductase [Anaerolineaceae bacterium]